MKHASFALVLAVLGTAPAVPAQGATIDPQCRAVTPLERASQDACQKAIDLFTYLAPQLAGAISGGNAVSGEHSSRGGPGHFSIGFRANAVRGRLPDVDSRTPALTGAVASDYPVNDQYIPVPAIDAALGLFPGLEIGGTRTLAVDGLLNVAYIPEISEGDLSITLPDGSLKLGFGARLAITEETSFSPGISVTWIQRDLPRMDLVATPGSDQLNIDDFLAKTTSWRGVIGKNFGVLGLTAGFGQDDYKISALANVRVVRTGITYSAGPIAVVQRLKRDNAFASAALRFPVFSLVGEYGRVSGGKLDTFNTFGSSRADDALEYASIAIRLRF